MNLFRLLALAIGSGVLVTTSGHATVLREDFETDPTNRGWQVFGESGLFAWNTAGALQVTWDSSRPNSYFALPLGISLTSSHDFAFGFDLLLTEFTAGVNPEKPNPFQLSLGLLNLAQATQTEFWRGSGFNSPNLVDFSFFPDPGEPWMWGPSITAAMIDHTATNWSSGGFGPFGLETGKVYRVNLNYSAAARTLTASVSHNNEPIGTITPCELGPNFQDFVLDHFAICSYTDAGQHPAYAGSIFARGTVDNIELVLPDSVLTPITGKFIAGHWEVKMASSTNWLYQLERTVDLNNWKRTSASVAGTGSVLSLVDSNAPPAAAFYRVVAYPNN